MKPILILTAGVAALALTACGRSTTATNTTAGTETTVTTGETTNAAAPAMPAATGGQAFANTAAASDAFEIASSRLALEKSGTAAIKTYAQSMIDAHTASTAKLKTVAGGLSPAITPDPTLTAAQAAKIEAMRGLSGSAFDQAYVAAQTEGHQQTLDALRAYAGTGDVAALKAFATELTPTVAAHLNMAKGLKA